MTVKLLVGDVRDRIREVPDGSVDLVACSPPFLALRKYGDNAAEMGSERTPADFLDALLELTQEFRRVLTPHGSIAIELGDTYSGSGGGGGDYLPGGLREGQPGFAGSAETQRQANARHWREKNERRCEWPLAKSLTLIPTLYPASLAYGWNMLNPPHTFPRWRVRNVIVWARPNPPVGALGDKVRPATSYITVACTSGKRWFDLDAVRTEHKEPPPTEATAISRKRALNRAAPGNHTEDAMTGIAANPAGAPPLDWWEDDDPTGHATLVLPTAPFKGAHYATWPPALAERLIKMMCPLRVCTTCGEPSRRITMHDGTLDPSRPQAARAMELAEAGGLTQEHLAAVRAFGISDAGKAKVTQNGAGKNSDEVKRLAGEAKAVLGGYFREFLTERPKSVGWSDCHHNTWRPGQILDPFAGSSTTLAVAQGLGRDAVGIELYPVNAELSRERCGMFLEVC